MLIDLAHEMSLSLPAPLQDDFQEKVPNVQGCYYDQDDALVFARLFAIGRALRQRGASLVGREQELLLKPATLTWVPFQRQENFLTTPVTALRLPVGLLS